LPIQGNRLHPELSCSFNTPFKTFHLIHTSLPQGLYKTRLWKKIRGIVTSEATGLTTDVIRPLPGLIALDWQSPQPQNSIHAVLDEYPSYFFEEFCEAVVKRSRYEVICAENPLDNPI
jgi:hypothetical protein